MRSEESSRDSGSVTKHFPVPIAYCKIQLISMVLKLQPLANPVVVSKVDGGTASTIGVVGACHCADVHCPLPASGQMLLLSVVGRSVLPV